MCETLGMLFVLVMFYKCAVVCEIWRCCGVREERLLRREGGRCFLRADHDMRSGDLEECSASR